MDNYVTMSTVQIDYRMLYSMCTRCSEVVLNEY